MRNAFVAEIASLAQEDPRVVVLAADIGNRLFDGFKAACPERFYNCGVAEANMTGMAAGMASCGLRPFTYTIAPFATTRCLEQIRVDLAYPNLPVVVCGVGAGYSYASLGATHHACEDIAFLRAIPNLTVVCPGDAHEVRLAVRECLRHEGPVYLRLGKKGEPVVHPHPPADFRLGRALPVRGGSRVCLLSTGTMLPVAVEAGHQLEAGVVSLHTVKPLDLAFLEQAFETHQLVVTLEEHSLLGGLGGAVAEWYCDRWPRPPARLLRLGTPDAFPHEAGGQAYRRAQVGLTADGIVARVREAL